MGIFSCDLTNDAKLLLLEELLAEEIPVRVHRSTQNILSENWSFGSLFTGVAFHLIWEAEKKTWWVSFHGRLFCRRQRIADIIDKMISIVASHPGCSTYLKGKPPAA